MRWIAAAALATVALMPTAAGAAVSPHSSLPPGACDVRHCGPLGPSHATDDVLSLPPLSAH